MNVAFAALKAPAFGASEIALTDQVPPISLPERKSVKSIKFSFVSQDSVVLPVPASGKSLSVIFCVLEGGQSGVGVVFQVNMSS